MKRQVQLLFVLLILPLLSMAQTKVNASEIIAKINRGEAVSYKNAEIEGDLDLTKLQNRKLKKEVEDKNNSKEYISTVTAPLSFVNCTFRGDVLAYYNPSEGVNMVKGMNEVYNTDFEKEVRFQNCTFEKKSAFKYSAFKQGANFAASRFSEEALFKYSKFSKAVDFSDATFRNDANFKYVDFPVMANFSGATFYDEANFKYAEFPEGVTFQKATFNDLANFKYAKLSNPVNMKGASFNGSDDFKYTKVNNKKATRATLMETYR
ncbi:pentapeptide repeat-containing protein [Pontibacter ruber]|uniref:Pentapeptide repeat-containing protein n=1 Tax=Pontibacter ruber TaxID=1343895 RepID=A0ABW5D2H4_9BACT|nr:pentapeptide repeat-containing protein [Pontibacter ruber]